MRVTEYFFEAVETGHLHASRKEKAIKIAPGSSTDWPGSSEGSPENELLFQHNKIDPDFLGENQWCHYQLN